MTKRRVHAEPRKSPEPPTVKACPTCGREFKVHICTSLRGGGKYCSRQCRARTGANNPNWRGGRIKDAFGRVMVYAPEHPGVRLFGGTHIFEYRLIAEQSLGRLLTEGEIVHHKNGDHTDNSPKNLEVMTQAEHARLHMIERRRNRERKVSLGV